MKLRIKPMIQNIRRQKPTNQNKKKREYKKKKNKDNVSSLWDNYKQFNIHFIRVPEEEKEQVIGNLFEKIMKENFPNSMKEIDTQVQEAQRVPKQDGPERPTP